MNDILSAPCEVAIEITGRCNLNCSYCFNNKCGLDIPISKIKKLFDHIDDMHVFEVCISGGEPFLHPDIISILDYAQKKRFNLSIVTNGAILTKDIIKQLNDRDLIDVMQISVDSHLEEVHNKVRGDYKSTIENLQFIKNHCDSLPMIGMVIHKQNYDTITDSLKILSSLCYQFHLMNIMATEKSLQHKELLYLNPVDVANTWKKIKSLSDEQSILVDVEDHDLKAKETARFTGCTAGKTKVVITPDLHVIPCDMTRDLIVGDLNKESLKNIWDNNLDRVRNLEIEPCYNLNKQWISF